MIALGIGLFDSSNPLVVLNQKLHSSKLYNVFQLSIAVVAAFSGGAYLRMREGPPACFVAGTMILTAVGLAAIENIRAGDKVISTNTDIFEVAEKVVVETYIRKVSKLVHLKVNGEMIDTTVDHSFYVKDAGFVDAGRLTVGDKLLDLEGSILTVENVWIEVMDTPVEVYNFQVADFHTYHVGNTAVLVHNAEYKAIKSKIGKDSGLAKEAEKACKNQQVKKIWRIIYMKVISIEYPVSLEQCDKMNDNIDVFVMLENGKRYCVTVAAIDWVQDYIGAGYMPCGAPNIIVRELRHQLIEEAINEYAEGDAYWLRVFSMSYGDVIPD